MSSDTGLVFVVEDDEGIRETMQCALEREGYRVETAKNGRDALAQLRVADPRPGVILLDLMMPVMDGWTFRREQLQDSALGVIPVIVMSADATVQAKAESIGATGYLKKPLRLETLLDAVMAYCAPRAD
jgi:CheY-like chemotaxis protein